MKPFARRFHFIAVASAALGVAAVWAATAFSPVDMPIAYVAQPAPSRYDVTSGGEVLYMGDYSLADWSGNLHAYPVCASGVIGVTDSNGVCTPGKNELWMDSDGLEGAAAVLDTQHWDTGRKIVTLDKDRKPVPFRKKTITSPPNGLSEAEQFDKLATTNDDERLAVLKYLRGDRSNEHDSNGTYAFRDRPTVLGAIVHSSPLYWKDDGGNKTVFVGANDGALHAFDAVTGAERFAYVPRQFISRLMELRTEGADGYFVDGQMDVRKYSTSALNKSVLVGALGPGGRGLFALDVSNLGSIASEADAASKILWEISANDGGDFKHLGYTYGQPYLGVLPNGNPALFMANGYNNKSKVPPYGDEGSGKASLFIINPADGVLIRKTKDHPEDNDGNNGLSTPTFVDTDGDGRVDRAYAGDLNGNLWRFNFPIVPNSNPPTLSTSDDDWKPTLIFKTENGQAITSAPAVMQHPVRQSDGKLTFMVLFGTGRLLSATDLTASNTQDYVYGIWDNGTLASTNSTGVDAAKLLLQDLSQDIATGKLRVRTATANPPNWTEANKTINTGCRLKLPLGERMTGDRATIVNGVYTLVTTNPTAGSGSPPHENWFMQLNALTCGATETPRLDLNADGSLNSLDSVKVSDAFKYPVGLFLSAGGSSQPVGLRGTATDVYQAASDRNFLSVGGVANGHFDFDIYYNCTAGPGSCRGHTHVHQYDDKYNVTGVNMLNSSNTKFNLINAIPSTDTKFKILVANQYLNPAVQLKIGAGASYEKVKSYAGQASISSATALLASLPEYTRTTVGNLVFALPVDGFATKDWWGGESPPVPRAGLIPTATGCVVSGTLGTLGAWRNGALTIQLVKSGGTDGVTAADLVQNVPGDSRYGWRLSNTSYNTKLLAEYTTFWHANGTCSQSSNWLSANPVVKSKSSSQNPYKPAPDSDPVGIPSDPGGGSGNTGFDHIDLAAPLSSSYQIIGVPTAAGLFGRTNWRILQ